MGPQGVGRELRAGTIRRAGSLSLKGNAHPFARASKGMLKRRFGATFRMRRGQPW
jgi:hypothetical protein